MSWTFTAEVEPYARAVGPLLGADPAAHTISLTVIETARARRGEDELFGWWTDSDGAVTGAVSHTAPYPVLLGVVPDEAIRPLVDDLRATGRHVAGVNGNSDLAAQVAAIWISVAGGRAMLGAATRLFRLGRPIPPEPMPAGRARTATGTDTELLSCWIDAFHRDIGESRSARRSVVDKLSFAGWTLWEDGDGVPVSVAGRGRLAAGVVRVAPVYTPPEQRRHGYAAAATLAASQVALDAGAGEVVLFTDLTNPTSNGVYRRIGYVPVSDRTMFRFID
ncbi:MAG TPA: GNAT family N-acetyltransferase [Mycobacteriales bacterium]|jgi:RimJ/RimL family protein N-acetyltransferase|nr:GNAT family N-acetyltransferase [Mycobacteriales bacterium]